MAANANSDLSTISSPAEAVPDDLPVARVSQAASGVVAVEWGDDGVTLPNSSEYSPYFVARNDKGKEPKFRIFGSLLHCNGGTLTVEGTIYHIQVIREQTNDLAAINEQIQAFKPALEFVKKKMEEATYHKPMSAASFGFAKLLLEGYQISVKTDEPCMDPGPDEMVNPPPYEWKVETKDGGTLKKGEHEGISEAMEWFKNHFLKESAGFDLVLVTKKPLPKLKGNGRSAAGEGDLVIGNGLYITQVDDPYEYAYGLVELKTDEYKVKPGQSVLELASLSTTSRFGRNVALLASDCKHKWQLYYFEDLTTILRREYLHSSSNGRRCWEDFKTLIGNAETRKLQASPARYKQTLNRMEEVDKEHEQDLGGFDSSQLEDSKAKALEKQAMLETLANGLAEVYGERPIVPPWATAQAVCPDYYL